MSLNTAHHPSTGGVVIFSGEYIILFCSGVTFTVEGGDNPALRGSKQGKLYLTTHRIIFISEKKNDPLQSFACPFSALRNVDLEQPIFGANYIKGSVKAQPNGGWAGEAKFKLSFKQGGAIDFGKAMLEAARLASRHGRFDEPPPYETVAGDFMAAPPAYYEAPPQAGLYGWAPPYQAFPDRPEANSVYMTSAPPPYPGIGGYAAPVPPAGAGGVANGYGYQSAPPEPGFIDPSTNVAFVPAYGAPPPPYTPEEKKKQ